MKTLGLSTLLTLSALAAVPATAQTRPASPAAGRTVATKPAAKPASSTATKTTTTAKPAAKPAAAPSKTATAKPVAKPAPAVVEAEEEAAAPAKTTSTKAKAPAKTAASGSEFGKGSMAANLGVGFGLGYGYGLFGNVSSIPALSLSVERGIIDDIGPGVISVGGLVGYRNSSWKSGSYRGTWHNILVSARGAYHYNFLDNPKVDTYAGVSLGMRVESYSDNFSDEQYRSNYGGTWVTSGIFIGGRYMLTNNLGAFGELGYDMSYLKVGLTARF